MRNFLGLQHVFFRPLWRRVAVVALCLGWAAVEFASGALIWGGIFAALGLVACYEFFVAFDPRDDPPKS